MTARPMWTARWRLDARSAPRVARSAQSSSAWFARSLAAAAIADERGALAVVVGGAARYNVVLEIILFETPPERVHERAREDDER